jgi:hypothetical protein
MLETTTQTGVWEVDTLHYEKWINRARGEKFYLAIFHDRKNRKVRLSKTKFKRASDLLEWTIRFKTRFI